MSNATSILDDRLITEGEVEAKLRWSKGTAAVKRCRGSIPFVFLRMGRQIRYRVSDVDAYLASATVAPKSINN